MRDRALRECHMRVLRGCKADSRVHHVTSRRIDSPLALDTQRSALVELAAAVGNRPAVDRARLQRRSARLAQPDAALAPRPAVCSRQSRRRARCRAEFPPCERRPVFRNRGRTLGCEWFAARATCTRD
jgi:hypothetical protein